MLGDFSHGQPVIQILANCDEIEVLHIEDAPFPVALGVLRFGRGVFNAMRTAFLRTEVALLLFLTSSFSYFFAALTTCDAVTPQASATN